VGAAGVALAMVLAFVLCATIARYRRIVRDKGDRSEKRSLMIKSDNNSGSYGGAGFLVGMTDIVGSDKPLQFSYQQLLTATNNFSSENRIQGSVFLGKLNGSFVAIKQMRGNMTDELKILSQVHHGNVVRLVGMCANPNEKLYLVYEYAENGSLSDCLHHQTAYPDSSFSRTVGLISWRRRLQIALDVACGLEYLHNYTKPSLVHKDVKSSNILLDQQFRAKVTNFGMAKSSYEGAMMTSNIVGTQGYMAPEYLEHGMVTTRADVFSFGVVLLELLSGREAIAGFNTPLHTTVPKTEKELGAWIDPRLQNAYPRDIAWSVASLAKTCVATDPAQRPDMKEISFALSKLYQASQEWESCTRYKSAAIEAR
jgi:serine/threonine protein kinase